MMPDRDPAQTDTPESTFRASDLSATVFTAPEPGQLKQSRSPVGPAATVCCPKRRLQHHHAARLPNVDHNHQ